jgi:hypothetical protein
VSAACASNTAPHSPPDLSSIGCKLSGVRGKCSFKYTLEIDPAEAVLPPDYIAAIGHLLQWLRSAGMDAVAACEFEDRLPRNVRRLNWSIPAGPESQAGEGQRRKIREPSAG